jgi:hypothetical protein
MGGYPINNTTGHTTGKESMLSFLAIRQDTDKPKVLRYRCLGDMGYPVHNSHFLAIRQDGYHFR